MIKCVHYETNQDVKNCQCSFTANYQKLASSNDFMLKIHPQDDLPKNVIFVKDAIDVLYFRSEKTQLSIPNGFFQYPLIAMFIESPPVTSDSMEPG